MASAAFAIWLPLSLGCATGAEPSGPAIGNSGGGQDGGSLDNPGEPVDALSNNATYVSASGIPAHVTAGGSFTVHVTMQNTGATTWSNLPTHGFDLGTQDPAGNVTWGTNHLSLATSATVKPGAQGIFTGTLTAPTTPGDYPTQGQMRQQGVGWFGQLTPLATISVIAGAPGSDAGAPDTGGGAVGPVGSLTVTVEAAGGMTPVTGAYVKVDAAHQGAVDASGAILFPSAPVAPFNVVATAPYCTTAATSVNAATLSVVLSMTCGPPTPNTDQIDLSTVIVENSPPDTPSWPITAPITELDLAQPGVYVNFEKRNGFDSWPDIPAGAPGAGLQYTLWIVLNINGQWYATGADEFWRGLEFDGGPPSGYEANLFYDHIRWPVMSTYQPVAGELVGFFVAAGAARNLTDDSGTLVLERSNVLLVPLPPDTGAVYFVDPPCGGLASGGTLGMGQPLTSCDGRFTLTMQNGGDLALTWAGGQLWDDVEDGHPAGVNLVMQKDGDLVSYYNEGSNGGPIWSSLTSGNPGASLVLDNGGNLSVTLAGTILWQSNTGGH
jgi:hypothetical protein